MADKEASISHAATDCMLFLAQYATNHGIDRDMCTMVIDRICWSISEQINSDQKIFRRERSIPSLFKCLTEWLVTSPADTMPNPNVSLRVSEIIEETIHASVN